MIAFNRARNLDLPTRADTTSNTEAMAVTTTSSIALYYGQGGPLSFLADRRL